MEIKGEQFLKKVKIKQEKEELEEKLTELRQQENQVFTNQEEVIRDETPINDDNTNQEFDLNISQDAKVAYDNIMLEEEPTQNINPDKKRNYLILGLVLIILFLITILTFRMIMGDDEEKKDDGFTSTKIEEQTNDQLASTVDSNFQKIMNEKKKREEEINQRRLEETRLQASELLEDKEEINPMSDKALDETINKVQEKAQLSETQRIIQTIEEKQVAPKPIVVKQEPKKVVPKPAQKPKVSSVKELVNKVDSSKPNGYFIQVGAFTKTPSQNYINSIKKANLKYTVHAVDVKGTTYNKVLVGPYSSRAQAKQDVENVKRKLKLSSAFVLKF